RKTVTRRAVKIQPRTKADIGSYGLGQPFIRHPDVTKPNLECPYGRPGDRLWVRESWWQAGDWQATYPEDDAGSWYGSRRVVYSADGTPPNEPNTSHPNRLRNGAYSAAAPNKIWRHRPSIHMSRWASRILMEITGVRVERLQDITEEQAKAEGVRVYTDHAELGDWWHVEGIKTYSADPRKSFELLWSSVGGDWNANPWVWVVEFKRVTP
ncbi:morphogenetic protein, partial [Pseudomonas tolaasii]